MCFLSQRMPLGRHALTIAEIGSGSSSHPPVTSFLKLRGPLGQPSLLVLNMLSSARLSLDTRISQVLQKIASSLFLVVQHTNSRTPLLTQSLILLESNLTENLVSGHNDRILDRIPSFHMINPVTS